MLTDRKVARLKEPGRYRDVAPGLYVVVGASGSKSWIYRYQRAGREHMLGLGSVDAFNVREARLRARAARQQLADGVDPIEAKRKAAAAAALEAARAMTFAAAAEAYVAQHEAKWTRVHHHQVLNSLKMYALPVIGDLRVDAIGVPEVLRVIEALWVSKTTTADRVRNRIELVLDWAKARGLRSGDNPAAWKVIGHILPAKADIAPVKHFAAMPYAELPAFMAELRAVPGIGLRALEFAILDRGAKRRSAGRAVGQDRPRRRNVGDPGRSHEGRPRAPRAAVGAGDRAVARHAARGRQWPRLHRPRARLEDLPHDGKPRPRRPAPRRHHPRLPVGLLRLGTRADRTRQPHHREVTGACRRQRG